MYATKCQTLRDLEGKCASLKVELATSRDNESILQLNLSHEDDSDEEDMKSKLSLGEEVHTQDVKYKQLQSMYATKCQTLRDLEGKCASLKVELATSRDNESILQLHLSQEIMVRDLDVINLTNKYNQLKNYKARLKKQKQNLTEETTPNKKEQRKSWIGF